MNENPLVDDSKLVKPEIPVVPVVEKVIFELTPEQEAEKQRLVHLWKCLTSAGQEGEAELIKQELKKYKVEKPALEKSKSPKTLEPAKPIQIKEGGIVWKS